MSYEANVHNAQMIILKELLLVPKANFSELQKQTKLSSDHFNFHIKRLLDEKYITKNNEKYELTAKGKEYANRMDTDEKLLEKQPKISVVLVIENDKGEYLAQERLKQPYYGFWGRPTGKIKWGETFLQAGERELLEETGLMADLKVAGFYHKMDYKEATSSILEDKLFVVIYGKNPRNELIGKAEGCHNKWLSDKEFEKLDKKFQSVDQLTKLAKQESVGFLEQRYDYSVDEY